jgi:hypothetical protein
MPPPLELHGHATALTTAGRRRRRVFLHVGARSILLVGTASLLDALPLGPEHRLVVAGGWVVEEHVFAVCRFRAAGRGDDA